MPDHVFVWTLHDVVGAALFALTVVGVLGYVAYECFRDWRRRRQAASRQESPVNNPELLTRRHPGDRQELIDRIVGCALGALCSDPSRVAPAMRDRLAVACEELVVARRHYEALPDGQRPPSQRAELVAFLRHVAEHGADEKDRKEAAVLAAEIETA